MKHRNKFTHRLVISQGDSKVFEGIGTRNKCLEEVFKYAEHISEQVDRNTRVSEAEGFETEDNLMEVWVIHYFDNAGAGNYIARIYRNDIQIL